MGSVSVLPPTRVRRQFYDTVSGLAFGRSTSLYFAAAVECTVKETLRRAAENSLSGGRKRITSVDIQKALTGSDALAACYPAGAGRSIVGGGFDTSKIPEVDTTRQSKRPRPPERRKEVKGAAEAQEEREKKKKKTTEGSDNPTSDAASEDELA